MAKLNEDVIVIKVSELLKDNDVAGKIFDADTVQSLEAILQELVGADKMIEVIKE